MHACLKLFKESFYSHSNLYHNYHCIHEANFFHFSTPLIKLNKLSEETGCTIAVKAENLNPGGSVKDRAALYLIKDAEERGQ